MIIGIQAAKPKIAQTAARILQAYMLHEDTLEYFDYTREEIVSAVHQGTFRVGRTQSGYNWQHKSFADKLYAVASILTGLSVEYLHKHPNKQLPSWTRYHLGDNIMARTKAEFLQEVALHKLERWAPEETVKANKVVYTVKSLLTGLKSQNFIHPDLWVEAMFAEYTPKTMYHLNNHVPIIKQRFLEFLDEHKYFKGKRTTTDWLEFNKIMCKWIIDDVTTPEQAVAILKRKGWLLSIDGHNVATVPSTKIVHINSANLVPELLTFCHKQRLFNL
jgi:hypothetical protein